MITMSKSKFVDSEGRYTGKVLRAIRELQWQQKELDDRIEQIRRAHCRTYTCKNKGEGGATKQ